MTDGIVTSQELFACKNILRVFSELAEVSLSRRKEVVDLLTLTSGSKKLSGSHVGSDHLCVCLIAVIL
jgi:hypothetical protein